jgi:radical SAM protein with 4Fe4S-binding SPASM domain
MRENLQNAYSTSIPLIATAYELCVPLFVTLELTLKCNLRCKHCYHFDRETPMPKQTSGQELTPPEIYKILDDLAEAGCLEISFSGGEALLHPHLDDFIRYARERQFAVRVKSNGLLLTPERVARLVEAGAYAVDISLYGASPESHDAFTKLKGSFEKTVAGARNAVAAGLKLSLSFCLTKHNADEIEAMIALAESLPARHTIDPQITARYDGTTSSMDHRVDGETLDRLYRGPLFSALGGPMCVPDREVQCSCARTVAGITSVGDVYPCIGAPVKSGNLREQTFKEVWETSPQLKKIRGLVLDDFEACKPCPSRSFCRRSSGVVVANTGNYTGPEAWTCMEAGIIKKIAEDVEAGLGPVATESGAAIHRC